MSEKKASYWEMLKDPRWQKKRLKVMERAGWKCEECGSSTKTLNVHHTFYKKGAAPWEYPKSTLKCWCEDCHQKWHVHKGFLDQTLGSLGFRGLSMCLGLTEGFLYFDGIETLTDERAEVCIRTNTPFALMFLVGCGGMIKDEAWSLYDSAGQITIGEIVRRAEVRRAGLKSGDDYQI